MMRLIKVWVTTSFVGYHQWPAAPETRAYLRDRHRHRFGVRVEVDARGDNRELEFHDVLDRVEYVIDGLDRDDLGSCEQIADAIATACAARWEKRRVEAQVSEDDECGATVCLLP